MALGVELLGQRQAEAGAGSRSAAHRRTEADATRLRAVGHDQEQAGSAPAVAGPRVGTVREHPVQDPDRGQVAPAHSQQGVTRVVRIRRPEHARHVAGPQLLAWRMQDLLPRLRARGVGDHGRVRAAVQPVPAG